MENLITVKDFATSCGVSDSIIYRHIRNLKKQLEDHVIKQYGKKWLDETAQTLISQRIKQNPVVVSDGEQEKKYQELEKRNNNLQDHLMQLQDEYVKATTTIQAQTEQINKLETEKLQIEGKYEELEQARSQLDKIKSRKLTFKERLTGRVMAE